MPAWFTIQTPMDGRIVTSRASFDAETSDALVWAARRVHRGQFRPTAKAHHSAYVVLLDFGRDEYGLYVGSTGLTPEERFLNHRRA